VRELTLEIEREDFPFRLGQSIGVVTPGDPALGEDHHFRLYSVADLPQRGESGRPRVKICVKRCTFIDDFSGERRAGTGSTYLCDRRPGDPLAVAGPFGLAFEVPEAPDATLVLIGSGTGIAPFRAFLKHLYRDAPGFRGRVLLLHGARSGLELLYMNDHLDDFAQYYDEETFEAVRALSPRPGWDDPIAWDFAIQERGEEIWRLLGEPTTFVYVAGLEKVRDELDRVFARLAGSPEAWQERKALLEAERRWVELLY
jgi:ferredoxin--NADP+ reductase